MPRRHLVSRCPGFCPQCTFGWTNATRELLASDHFGSIRRWRDSRLKALGEDHEAMLWLSLGPNPKSSDAMSDAAPKADRAHLDNLQLEQSLSLLRMEKQSIQARPDDLKYPVLTLPNEITSEIFLHFLPPYPECPPSSGLLSPTLLTHICRKWREIALSTPTLWRAIWLDSDIQPDFGSRKQILESWLVRSCSCPISIKVFDSCDSVEEDILQALIPHGLRWEHLEVDLDGAPLHIIDGLTPLLRELKLNLDGSLSCLVSLKDAPLLRTVFLNDGATTNMILPWAQLTSLTLDDVYPKDCTPILLQTYNLVRCQLNIMRDWRHAIEPDVKLPCLESLVLVGKYGEVTEYLGTFIVPALRKLELPEMYLKPDPVSVLTAFISKSGCKLQEVRMTGPRSTPSVVYRTMFPLISIFSFEEPAPESEEEDEDDEAT
ncbi:hypothetical protein C8R43DRAFT_1106117 [Mycena crocata]|nr:hypothetical protein C8R43DRAFT_1106117 [Mycena crocata]